MTNEKKLIEICTIIWHPYYGRRDWIIEENEGFRMRDEERQVKMSEVDVIFTQKFMDKLREYLAKRRCWHYERMSDIEFWWIQIFLMDNLKNPVEYLYNLIK